MMLNHKVIDQLLWLWSLFDIKLLSFIAAGFTIYFGYHKISRKICVSYSANSSRIYDLHIPEVILSNKRDNTITISYVFMEIEGKGTLQLIKFESPLLLKGYDTQKIALPKYSALHGAVGDVEINIMDKLYFYLVTISGERITCENEGAYHTQDMSKVISSHVIMLNGIVLTNKMSYVFFYKADAVEKYCIIDAGFVLNGDNPFWFNQFPTWSEEDFRDALMKFGYHDKFTDYMLFRISERLESQFVYNKNDVENFLNSLSK